MKRMLLFTTVVIVVFFAWQCSNSVDTSSLQSGEKVTGGVQTIDIDTILSFDTSSLNERCVENLIMFNDKYFPRLNWSKDNDTLKFRFDLEEYLSGRSALIVDCSKPLTPLPECPGLDSVMQVFHATLETHHENKNWMEYVKTQMEYMPLMDLARIQCAEHPRVIDMTPCNYVMSTQILRKMIEQFQQDGRPDLVEQYSGMLEARIQLCGE